MTTKIPPHNFKETIDACICVIKNPDAEFILNDAEYNSRPEFTTGGIIMG
jgi:DNA gyrase subunit A